ncbi:DNA replication protein psf1 [Basidiobolus ranarum]|uniref:DNA replication complex GINS protein PSF1 n=1 Tax=Basidiobolus ranarum TaxID=34480 RepID=A0ABR2WUL8_9FUNG
MYGEEAYKLAKEAKRANERLPPYNEELVRNVCREIRILFDDLQRAMQDKEYRTQADNGRRCAALIQHTSLRRNKRCLLAYHKQRLERVKEIAWAIGEVPEEIQDNLSSNEIEAFKEYKHILEEYDQQFLPINLMSDLKPPKDLYIEVRVLKDCGEIQTDNGTIKLEKNSQHFIKRTDVERFITQGYIKHIS